MTEQTPEFDPVLHDIEQGRVWVTGVSALVLGAAILGGCAVDTVEVQVFPPNVRINPTQHYYFDMECTPRDPLQVVGASFGKNVAKQLIVACVRSDTDIPKPPVDHFEGDTNLPIVDDPLLEPNVIDIAYVGPEGSLDDFVIDDTGQYVTFFLDGVSRLKSVHINYQPVRAMYT